MVLTIAEGGRVRCKKPKAWFFLGLDNTLVVNGRKMVLAVPDGDHERAKGPTTNDETGGTTGLLDPAQAR